MARIEEIGKKKCRHKEQVVEICSHFDTNAYKKASDEFIRKADEKMDLLNDMKKDMESIPELETMKEHAKPLVTFGFTIMENARSKAREVDEMRERFETAIGRLSNGKPANPGWWGAGSM